MGFLGDLVIGSRRGDKVEEVHRVAFGRALWTEASVPVELGCALAEGCIHQPEAL